MKILNLFENRTGSYLRFLRHLPYFMVVAELQNLRQAAGQLGMTQPALSRRMQKLEHDLGFSLFRREGRGIVLTPEGRALFDDAEQAMASFEDTFERVRALTPRPAAISRERRTPTAALS
jgi:LysR family transcriptional regulator, nitrogen assimilation regulatory protein